MKLVNKSDDSGSPKDPSSSSSLDSSAAASPGESGAEVELSDYDLLRLRNIAERQRLWEDLKREASEAKRVIKDSLSRGRKRVEAAAGSRIAARDRETSRPEPVVTRSKSRNRSSLGQRPYYFTRAEKNRQTAAVVVPRSRKERSDRASASALSKEEEMRSVRAVCRHVLENLLSPDGK